jgi:hypothetical protein
MPDDESLPAAPSSPVSFEGEFAYVEYDERS